MTVLSLSYDIGFRSYDIGFRSYDIGFRFQGRLAREAWEACRGGLQGRLAREACKGRLQGRFARDACKGACKGGLWGEFAKEACEGGLQGRLARETCEGKGGLHGTSLAIIFCKPLCKPPLQPPLANFPCKSPLEASPANLPRKLPLQASPANLPCKRPLQASLTSPPCFARLHPVGFCKGVGHGDGARSRAPAHHCSPEVDSPNRTPTAAPFSPPGAGLRASPLMDCSKPQIATLMTALVDLRAEGLGTPFLPRAP
jgi:hypothetical protein